MKEATGLICFLTAILSSGCIPIRPVLNPCHPHWRRAVLWGSMAAGAIGFTTAYVIEQEKKRKEEEARARLEAERANVEARAREQAQREYQAALKAAKEARRQAPGLQALYEGRKAGEAEAAQSMARTRFRQLWSNVTPKVAMGDTLASGLPTLWPGCQSAYHLLKSSNSIANASASNPVIAR